MTWEPRIDSILSVSSPKLLGFDWDKYLKQQYCASSIASSPTVVFRVEGDNGGDGQQHLAKTSRNASLSRTLKMEPRRGSPAWIPQNALVKSKAAQPSF